jgi:hypothetical protein
MRDGQANAPYELLARATAEAKASGSVPAEAESSARRKRDAGGIDSPGRWDLMLVGSEGIMLFQRHSEEWIISPHQRGEMFLDVPKTITRVANEDTEWLAAIKGGPAALSNFDYAGPFTEVVLLGNLAVRLGKKIQWDSERMKALNAPEADALIQTAYRSGWDLPVADELLKIG